MVEVVGALAVSLMVVFYALEKRSPAFVLLFAGACLASSGYAVAIRSWPFAFVEVVWAGVALRRWAETTTPSRRSGEEMPMPELERAVAPFCTLGPDTLRDRIAYIRREILPEARRSELLADGRAWEFENSPLLKLKLQRLIDLERECCREGVTFRLEELVARPILRLEVHGIDPRAKAFGALG